MVAPLALPLIGLLAAGGATAAAVGLKPHLENREARIRGRYAQGLLDELGPGAGPDATARSLFGGGLLDAGQYVGAMGDTAQRDLGWFNAETSRMGAETSRMGLFEGMAQARIGSVPSPGGVVQGDLAWDGLVRMESGGNPLAQSAKGALGIGQIMPGNIGPWAREVIDPSLSDAEALEAYRSDVGFQETLGRRKFSQMVNRYGLRDAYARWHSGVGFEQAVREGRHDGNMSTYDYVRANMQAYERRTAEAAALDEREFRGWAVQTGGTEWEQQALQNPYLPRSMAEEITGNVVQRMSGDAGDRLEAEAASALAARQATEPALRSSQRIDDVLELLPEAQTAARWGEWFDTPSGGIARRRVNKWLFEVRQEWIDRMMKGREPSPAVMEELMRAFPTDVSVFSNRKQLEGFLRGVQQDLAESVGEVGAGFGSLVGTGDRLRTGEAVIPDADR